ncbi:MAG: hypothetical protein Kow0010_26060 [Dehalococcoidia bacterium]
MIVGGAFIAWAAFLAVVALTVAIGASPELKTLAAWCLAAAATLIALAFAYWTYALATLAYIVEDQRLVIRWGFRQFVIPIDNIQRMVPGRTLDVAHVRGLNWWGCHVGVADVGRIGRTAFFSTHSTPAELLYVVTAGGAYALTVTDQAAFAEEIQSRAGLGPVRPSLQRSHVTGLGALPFWHDRVAIWAAALSLVTLLVLVAYVFAQYPSLPEVVQISYPDFGGVVRIGDKSELLRIAYVGLGIGGVNLALGIALHAYERATGLWLMASGGMLQLVLLGAAIAAFERA